jgi:hypothetical protein
MSCRMLARSLFVLSFCFLLVTLKNNFAQAALNDSMFESNQAHLSEVETLVSYKHRALVIMTELDQRGAPELKYLYQALEKLTVNIPTELYDDYRFIETLPNNLATIDNLKKTLLTLTENPQIESIDMILAVHGNEGTLSFADGRVQVKELTERILNGGDSQEKISLMRKKLRLMYNLSCFGKTHQQELFKLGFDAVVGSQAVNANAEVEYPSFLSRWTRGLNLQKSLAPSNTRVALYLADEPLRKIGRAQNNFLKKVNSKKSIFGKSQITINSPSI